MRNFRLPISDWAGEVRRLDKLATLVNLALNGAAIGMFYFMIASGLSLIFGLMHVLNFAHGSLFMWGAYVSISVWLRTGSFLLALLAGAATGFLLGAATEYFLVRPLYRRPIFLALLTLGLALVLDETVKAIWGPNLQPAVILPGLDGSVSVMGQSYPAYRLVIIGVGAVVLTGVWLLLNRTRLGIIIRAGVQDAQMVEALGINVRRVFTLVFALGGALAGLGGAVLAPDSVVHPLMGLAFLLKAFIVVVIGGFGSYGGTAAAAILLGMAEQFVGFYAPEFASGLAVALMAVVLLLKPEGLFTWGKGRAS